MLAFPKSVNFTSPFYEKSCSCFMTKSTISLNNHHKLLLCLAFMFVCVSSAADWKLDEPAWSGRMKITAKGKMAYIKLEDKNTGRQKNLALTHITTWDICVSCL